jgi:predicted RNA-binding Zn ribbon-like protein
MEEPLEALESSGRAPAPGGLALVQALVNSIELPDGDDELATADAATEWLRDHQVELRRPVTETERRRLLNVREGLRVLLTAHTGEVVDTSVGENLTRQLNAAVLRPVISSNGGSLSTTTPGVAQFLGSISAGIVEATVAGTWERLKVCRDDSCRWAFYDFSKNGRGAWCSMRVCGCRNKSRAYRARQKVTGGSGRG